MVYFLIPTYNEQENIPQLIENLLSTLNGEQKHYVFSDDGSSDSTKTIIAKLLENEKFTILGDGSNKGPGIAFNNGFNWILENSKSSEDVVVTLEADNTSDLTILPHMVSLSKMGYQLILASVYAQGGGFENTSFFRKFLSFGANSLFRMIFKIKVLTLSSFYRVYRIEVLKKIKAKNDQIIKEAGFICMIEVLIKAIRINATIVELPMTLRSSKRKGKSKMKIFKTVLAYIRFLFKKK